MVSNSVFTYLRGTEMHLAMETRPNTINFSSNNLPSCSQTTERYTKFGSTVLAVKVLMVKNKNMTGISSIKPYKSYNPTLSWLSWETT